MRPARTVALVLGLLAGAAWLAGAAPWLCPAAAQPVDWVTMNADGAAAAAAQDWPAAERAFRAALEALGAETAGLPTDSLMVGDDDSRVAVVATNLAVVRLATGDIDEARELLAWALAIRQRVFGTAEFGTAAILNNLGELERQAGDLGRARELHEAALAMRRELREPGHPEIAESLNNLGVSLRDMGELAAAAAHVGDALDARRERLGPAHPATLESAANLAAIALEAGDSATAASTLHAALEAVDAAAAAGPGGAPLPVLLLRNLVELLVQQADLDTAVLICEDRLGDRPAGTSLPQAELASVCARALGAVADHARAVALLEAHLVALDGQSEPLPAVELELRWALAEATALAGDLATAEATLDRVVELLTERGDERLPMALNNRAFIAFERGRPRDAAGDLEAALGLLEGSTDGNPAAPKPGDSGSAAAEVASAPAVDPALQRDLLANYASVLRALDRHEEAIGVEARLLDALRTASGPEPAAGE